MTPADHRALRRLLGNARQRLVRAEYLVAARREILDKAVGRGASIGLGPEALQANRAKLAHERRAERHARDEVAALRRLLAGGPL